MEETSVGTIHISPHERLKKYALKDIDELYNDFHIKEGGLNQEQIEQQSCQLFFTSPFFFSAYKTGVYQSLQCDIVCIGYCLFHHRCLFEIQLRQKRDQCGHHFVYAYNQWDGTADPGTKSRPCRGYSHSAN